MEVYENVPKQFLAKYERHEPLVTDATSLMTYKTCGRKYFFTMVLGFSQPESPPYFINGSSYHRYRDHFEINWKSNDDLSFDDRFDLSHLVAQNEALKLWDAVTGGKPVGVHTKWDWITKERLILSLTKASEWLKNEKRLGNIIVVATEQPFIVEVLPGVFYGGKADQVVRWNNRLWGRDFKSSSQRREYFKRQLKPNTQFIGYTIAEELLHGSTVDGQLVEVLYNTKTEGPEIIPYPNSFNTFEKGLWRRDLEVWSKQINKSRQDDYYPVNEKHCPFCPFHIVCTSTSENAMEGVLDSKFRIKPWDFTNTDGDLEDVA